MWYTFGALNDNLADVGTGVLDGPDADTMRTVQEAGPYNVSAPKDLSGCRNMIRRRFFDCAVFDSSAQNDTVVVGVFTDKR